MAGLPVIASDIPALRKIFTEEKLHPGELLDSSAGPREFASLVRKIINNEATYKASTKEFALRYSYENQEQKILDLIKNTNA